MVEVHVSNWLADEAVGLMPHKLCNLCKRCFAVTCRCGATMSFTPTSS